MNLTESSVAGWLVTCGLTWLVGWLAVWVACRTGGFAAPNAKKIYRSALVCGVLRSCPLIRLFCKLLAG